jgi:phosphoribosylformimino-5-aminoimidazole carboxamide ribotide isomerase
VLIPCIDLQNGQAVQLVHGRKRELAVPDVPGLLEKFKQYEWLHIIDLDAAMGKHSNARLARQVCEAARDRYGIKVRVGGGIRTISRAREVADWEPEQIIIGSAAFRGETLNFSFLKRLVSQLSASRIVIALDTARGQITTKGWRRRVALCAADVVTHLEPFCAAFLCTDVDREGTMTGANLKWYRELRKATRYPIIAAGGIKTRREITSLEKIGMDAAVGMAVYKNLLR